MNTFDDLQARAQKLGEQAAKARAAIQMVEQAFSLSGAEVEVWLAKFLDETIPGLSREYYLGYAPLSEGRWGIAVRTIDLGADQTTSYTGGLSSIHNMLVLDAVLNQIPTLVEAIRNKITAHLKACRSIEESEVLQLLSPPAAN
jgi:hypothetical protein